MRALNPIANWQAVQHYAHGMMLHRELAWEMTKREFTERYVGQVFGYLWAFAHPLIFILVYVFIFSVVFQVRLSDSGLNYPADFICYLLAGLVPWLASQDALSRSSQVIVSNSSLVKQVMFPIEVLPTKCVFAAILTELILLAGFLAYSAIRLHYVPSTVILLPFLIGIQCLGLLGLTMMVSAIGAYVRDLKDFIQVFCFVNVYFMPVVYLPAWVPAPVRPLLYLNPFSYQTWCFQDVLFFGRMEHYWAWPVFIILNLAMFGLGCRSFKCMKHHFGDFL